MKLKKLLKKKAPEFSLEGDKALVSLKDFKGKKVILYFYPRDLTPGCTIEANDFTSLIKDFEKNNCEIIGISGDSIKSHGKFRKKEELEITLASDEDHLIQEKYGVWQKKKFMGREYIGTSRTTFLIDERGFVREIWENVKVKGHAKKVLESVKNLN
tara:strand:+ start:11877 stop:12347 length:471 start_codon:yes stop_codon:yes gene_type:complete